MAQQSNKAYDSSGRKPAIHDMARGWIVGTDLMIQTAGYDGVWSQPRVLRTATPADTALYVETEPWAAVMIDGREIVAARGVTQPTNVSTGR